MAKQTLTAVNFVHNGSLAAGFSSATIDVTHYRSISIELAWVTAVATGTLVAQASVSGQNWVNIDMAPIIVNASNDTALMDIQTTAIDYIRLTYIPIIAGAGTIEAYISAKE